MFRFAQPDYLLLLLLVPLAIAVYVLYRRAQKRRLARFGDPDVIVSLMPEASPKRVRNKFIVTTIALTLMILALGQPQFGARLHEVTRKGVEIMLAVDVSNSMLAEDFAPNRLERTKNAVNRLIEQLDKDRVGMVVFAGDAYIQLPITSDILAHKAGRWCRWALQPRACIVPIGSGQTTRIQSGCSVRQHTSRPYNEKS